MVHCVHYVSGCLTLMEILEIYWNYFSSWKSNGNLQNLLEIFWLSSCYNSCISKYISRNIWFRI